MDSVEPPNMIEVLPSFELDRHLFRREEKLKKAKKPITTKIRLDKTEYQPGEVVRVSLIIENKTKKLVNTISRKVSLKSRSQVTKNGKAVELAPFLSMYDTAFTTIPIEHHGRLEHQFSFKIPTYILDTYCPHQFGEHLCMPPTFGSVGHRATVAKQITFAVEVEVETDDVIKVGHAPITVNTSNTEYNYHTTFETTKSQLEKISQYINDEIDVLAERKTLSKLDIQNTLSQDEIIYSPMDSKKSHYSESEFSSLRANSTVSAESFRRKSRCMPFDVEIFDIPNEGRLVASFDASLLTIDAPFPITFKFQPAAIDRGAVKFPKQVSFKPLLLVVNYQSLSPIPVVFDKEFMFEDGFDEHNLAQLREKYGPLKLQLIDMASQVNGAFPYSAIQMAHSLETLKAQRLPLDILGSHNIALKRWEWDSKSKSYVSHQTITLSRNKSLALVKPFQLCQLGRLYLLEMRFTAGKRLSTGKIPRCPVSIGTS